MFTLDSEALGSVLTQITHVNRVRSEHRQLWEDVKPLVTDKTVLFWFIRSLKIS